MKIRHAAQKSKIPKIGRLAYACMVSRVQKNNMEKSDVHYSNIDEAIGDRAVETKGKKPKMPTFSGMPRVSPPSGQI